VTELVVGRRYARALFLLARERGVVEATANELKQVARVFEEPAVLRSLTAPGVYGEARLRAVSAISTGLSLSQLVGDFLALLARRRRLGALSAISRLFEQMMDAELGQLRARILSAVALPPAAVAEVRAALERKTGRRVLADVEVVPELLGGLVVHAAGRVYDASARRQLERLGAAMAEG